MARQERAEQTRRTILAAAASRFDAVGFLGASLSDILTEAGVTKGALYFHFKSKEDLADALMQEQFAVLDSSPMLENPGLQTVIDWCHSLAVGLQNDVHVRASIRLVIEQGSFVTPAASAYKQWIDLVHACLLAARAAGDLRKDVNAHELAQYTVSSFTGIQLSSQVLTGRTDLRERVTFMWATMLPSIVPPRRLHKFAAAGNLEELPA
ncbi:ScbR family autoregulator-binding transcription factor [Amycolatopsis rhabdoformis]|uniref:ScbR family autoregulator-binding transcription factor n=1 Tax=Amycolatopsis rhabdoformis TaxID=1448059 RepID=A0ABZ1HXU9_9PSEU|nr:ScbR family autoregulator-binding transcription factor [Amycolatopsis rhabdoformis]WSE26403.1 ScbR family autoregulator-binding transcription factor [Amycolatopsis rhabdoformis]